jgi:hypothetical protein
MKPIKNGSTSRLPDANVWSKQSGAVHKEQHKTLTQKLKGHFGYYGITGNSVALGRFRWRVIGIWKKWLSRRSQKSRSKLNWQAMYKLLERFPLPEAIAVHSVLRKCAANP